MIILAADDEKLALEDLRENIKKAKPDAEIHWYFVAGSLIISKPFGISPQ